VFAASQASSSCPGIAAAKARRTRSASSATHLARPDAARTKRWKEELVVDAAFPEVNVRHLGRG
jgi:hypothetical protein